MNLFTNIDCIDSGTENCPCYLAVTGDCLLCSRLQGKDYCDCLWKGVCIYNEFIQNHEKANNVRKDFSAKIMDKKRYLEDLCAITLDVGRGFALKASVPGSYVFLKGSEQESYYHTPISVMKADIEKGCITVLVKSISAKTKALCMTEDKMTVRGVYRGGLKGINKITGKFSRLNPQCKLLIITKGAGFAPAVNFLDWCALSHAEVDMIIDTDKICEQIVQDYLKPYPNLNVTFQSLQSLISDTSFTAKVQTEKYHGILVLASDYYIGELEKTVQRCSDVFGKMTEDCPYTPEYICSNNSNICCGEGICGACSRTDAEGRVHKCCKCVSL